MLANEEFGGEMGSERTAAKALRCVFFPRYIWGHIATMWPLFVRPTARYASLTKSQYDCKMNTWIVLTQKMNQQYKHVLNN